MSQVHAVDNWFAVSREGLRQLMDGREKTFIVRELVQNSWDEPGVTRCDVTITPNEFERGLAWVEVKDDAPEGFADITHAYTLFANTRKRKDPDKRGRFNLGEKQVLSLCVEATITTTTGAVIFNRGGERTQSYEHTEKGSVFRGMIKMNRGEIKKCVSSLKAFIRPAHITTTINGEELPQRAPAASAEAKMTTEYEHEDGSWRRTRRKTTINVYKVRDGEIPMLYEMGIPVVELEGGDCFHYDVTQRVPLNQDRDNVSPAYLRDLRAEVMNVVAGEITEEQAAEPWAREATNSDRIKQDAFEAVIEKRYGDKVASVSVDDSEANHAAAAEGYTVLSGGSMTKGEWENARRFDCIKSSHQVAPTKHPEFSPSGVDTTVPKEKWTDGMKRLVGFVDKVCDRLFGPCVMVKIVRDKWNRFSGWYGGGVLTINLSVIGHSFFNGFPANITRVVDFLVHELGHRACENHLSDQYHKELTRLAGQFVELALEESELFEGE